MTTFLPKEISLEIITTEMKDAEQVHYDTLKFKRQPGGQSDMV